MTDFHPLIAYLPALAMSWGVDTCMILYVQKNASMTVSAFRDAARCWTTHMCASVSTWRAWKYTSYGAVNKKHPPNPRVERPVWFPRPAGIR